jgi:ParB family chromosome partitioning protein
MGHARAIINIDDEATQLTIFRNVIKKGLSVREVEEIVRNLNKQPSAPKSPVIKSLPPRFEAMRSNLAIRLSSDISLNRNTKGKGTIVITFNSDSELEKIISAIGE